jgi:hypothetical protein
VEERPIFKEMYFPAQGMAQQESPGVRAVKAFRRLQTDAVQSGLERCPRKSS